MPNDKKIDLITLGDELLLGIRQNGHLRKIGAELARHGLTLRRNLVCRDDATSIRESFESCWRSADIVITTGGLGPTSDDNTRETIADCLGCSLEFQPQVEAAIVARFQRLGRRMSPINLKQCYLPRGAELLPNPLGTAPGIFYKNGTRRLFMLPGPSSEMHPMLEKEVIPRLCAEGVCHQEDAYLQIRTMGVGESGLQELLTPVFNKFRGLGVSFCAHGGMVDVRLFSEGDNMDVETLAKASDECRIALGEDFICYGHCNLAKVIFNHLRADEKKLAVAESCTGGLLANAFTNIPGASKVFTGGVVCYNNDAKMEMLGVPECILQQHGAVSAETAVAMATGAAERFSAEFALSVTGFAGPGGGTAENPVGTLFIGYHSPCGTWSVRMVQSGERLAVKARAVNLALDIMRRKLCKHKIEDAIATMEAVV